MDYSFIRIIECLLLLKSFTILDLFNILNKIRRLIFRPAVTIECIVDNWFNGDARFRAFVYRL